MDSHCEHVEDHGRIYSRVAFAELKAPRGRLSPDQEVMREWLQELGSPWAEIRSLGDLEAFLESIDGFPAPKVRLT